LKITNSLVLASLLSLVAGFCLSYALAALSWRFLEQPCLRLKDRLAPYGAVAASIASSGNFKTAKA
jgi:peptidoglycan/LPS O-acetylase OafA/YrhL